MVETLTNNELVDLLCENDIFFVGSRTELLIVLYELHESDRLVREYINRKIDAIIYERKRLEAHQAKIDRQNREQPIRQQHQNAPSSSSSNENVSHIPPARVVNQNKPLFQPRPKYTPFQLRLLNEELTRGRVITRERVRELADNTRLKYRQVYSWLYARIKGRIDPGARNASASASC